MNCVNYFEKKVNIQEAICLMETKINELVEMYNRVNADHEVIAAKVKELEALIDYLLGAGLAAEVKKQLEVWLADGTLAGIINETLFQDITNKLNDLEISLKDYKYLVVDNDWTDAMKEALRVNKRVYIPAGEYELGQVNVPSDRIIRGAGNSTVIIPKSTKVFVMNGTLEVEYGITETIEDFDVNVKSSIPVVQGDYILLRGVRDSLVEADSGESWCLGYATPNSGGVCFGEYARVEAKTMDGFTLENTPVFPFYKKEAYINDTSAIKRNATTVQKVNFVENVVIKDLMIKGFCSPAIHSIVARNIVIENILNDAYNYTNPSQQGGIVVFEACLDSGAKNCEWKRTGSYVIPNSHYFLNVYRVTSSQDCFIDGCKAERATQSIDISYLERYFPSINCSIKNCYIKDASQTGITTHQGSYIAEVVGNKVVGCPQSIYVRTKNSIVMNNRVIGDMSGKSVTHCGIGLGDSNAINTVIEGNTINNHRTGILITDGTLAESRWKYCGAVIKNNMITNCILGIYILKNSSKTTDLMYITIEGNNIYSTKVETLNVRGIYLDPNVNGIKIQDNIISLRGPEVSPMTYGIDIGLDATKIELYRNKIRKCVNGIFDRRTTSGLPAKELVSIGNTFVDVNTEQNLVSSSIQRQNLDVVPYVSLTEVSNTTGQQTTNTIFAGIDGKLYFYDKNGVRYEIALSTT